MNVTCDKCGEEVLFNNQPIVLWICSCGNKIYNDEYYYLNNEGKLIQRHEQSTRIYQQK